MAHYFREFSEATKFTK